MCSGCRAQRECPAPQNDPLYGRPVPRCTFGPLAPNYFNFVNYLKYGSTTLTAIRNTKFIQSSLQSSKVIHTGILTQGRIPKGHLFFCWVLPTARALPLSAEIPCPSLPAPWSRGVGCWWWCWVQRRYLIELGS